MLMANIRVDWHDAEAHISLAAQIAPLLVPLGRAVSFRPHWSGGNHVNARVRMTDDDRIEADLKTATAVLGEWVAKRPLAEISVPESSILVQLAQAEGHRPDDSPHPNRTATLSFEQERKYLGSQELSVVRVAFEEGTAFPILDLYSSKGSASTSGRLTLLLVETASLYRSGGLRNGVRSLRAHGESFLAIRPMLRPSFDRLYERSREQLAMAVGRLLSGTGATDKLLSTVTKCGNDIDVLGVSCPEKILAAGAHSLGTESGSERWHPAITKWVSSRVLEGSEEERFSFARHRVLINLVYTLFPLTGVNAIGRFAAAYIGARVVSDCLGLEDDYFDIPKENQL